MESNLLKIYLLCGTVCFILYFVKSIFTALFGNNTNVDSVSSISMESRYNDMRLVNMCIDRCIIKTLYKYCNSDLTFTKKSAVSTLSNGSYRNCIDCLLRPNVYISDNESFFTVFSTNVYMSFISEVSEPIKKIIFKYWTGYDIGTYFDKDKKKIKPSILPYITEYTRNYIWSLRTDNEEYDKKMYEKSQDSNGGAATNYIELLNDYDKLMMQQLCLNLYNMNPSDGYSLSLLHHSKKLNIMDNKKE